MSAQVRALAHAAWRAMLTCLRLPVLLGALGIAGMLALALWLLGMAFWADAVAAVRAALVQAALQDALLEWLDHRGLQALRSVLAPMVVVAGVLPLTVAAALLLVSLLLMPAIAGDVAARRFPTLLRHDGASLPRRLFWLLGHTALGLLVVLVTLPLWLLPPGALPGLVMSALIWAWLSCRALAFAALAGHASPDERRSLLRRHRRPLRALALACGAMAALPLLMWATGAAAFILAPLLVLVTVAAHTLIFSFAAAWFAHYLLAALQALRASVSIDRDLH